MNRTQLVTGGSRLRTNYVEIVLKRGLEILLEYKIDRKCTQLATRVLT